MLVTSRHLPVTGEDLRNAANTKHKTVQALGILVDDVILKEVSKQFTNLSVDTRNQIERHYKDLSKEIKRAMSTYISLFILPNVSALTFQVH